MRQLSVPSLQRMVFRRHKVQAVVQAAVLEKVKGLSYDPVKGAQVTGCCSYSSCLGVAFGGEARADCHSDSTPSNWQTP